MNIASQQNRRGFLKMFLGGAALLGVSGVALRGGADASVRPVTGGTQASSAEEVAPARPSHDDEAGYDEMCDPGWSY